MMRRGTQAVQSAAVLGRGIALIPLESIAGELLGEFIHALVTLNLRDNTGRGDALAARSNDERRRQRLPRTPFETPAPARERVGAGLATCQNRGRGRGGTWPFGG